MDSLIDQSGRREKLSLNWEDAFRLYEHSIACENEVLRVQATIKLARMSKHAPETILERSVPILVQLLTSPISDLNPSIHEASAYCLKCIACEYQGRLALLIGESGAVPSILRLLLHSEGNLQRTLLKCLRNLVTFAERNRIIVFRSGGLEIVVSMLNACPDGLESYLLEILSALALSREVRRRAIFTSGGVRFLIESARRGRMLSRRRAAQAIGLLGLVKSARPTLVASGAIQALLELLQVGDASTKLVAGNALGVISSHVDYIRPVAQAGAIPLYVELLQGPEPMGKEIAEDVFCILAIVEENAVVIAEHLVRILQGDNAGAKAAAADVLWDLSGYKHLQHILRNSNAIPILVELLQDQNVNVREKVSGAIAQLSYNKADRVALADSGAIPVLINMLQDELEDLRDNAAETLVNFSEDPLLRDRISSVVDSPAFHSMQNRLMQIRASDVHMASSLRNISIEHLTGDPSLN
nr:protein ARABIDILLO 2 [Ipomoea trifida]